MNTTSNIATESAAAAFAASDPFAELPKGYFAAIAVDPASHFKSRTALQVANWSSRRDVEKHYRTMGLDELAALPVKELASPDGCHLFLWTSGPFLPQAVELLSAWGFAYSSIAFTWVKLRRSFVPHQLRLVPLAAGDLHVGLGLTTRKNSELVLLGRRGNCRRISKSVREIILAPVREHSRKPDEFFHRVEAYCAGPYCELFSREQRPGWTSWGDEVSKFNGDTP